jgi:hypothetical protein
MSPSLDDLAKPEKRFPQGPTAHDQERRVLLRLGCGE